MGREDGVADAQLPEVSKGGRPPYQPDARTARQVEAMVGYGIPVDEIARVIGVCENTLRKYYGDEIAVGATKANAKVIESLFRKATGEGQGAVAAAIFWAKTRCGWKETNVSEMTGPDGAPQLTVLIQRFGREAEDASEAREQREIVVRPSLTSDR
jgi:hypothetical protein